MMRKLHILLAGFFLSSGHIVHAQVSGHGPGTFEILSVNSQPAAISEGQAFRLILSGYNLDFVAGADGLGVEGLSVEVVGDTIFLSKPGGSCFATPPAIPPNDAPSNMIVPVDGLPAGTYTLDVFVESGCWGPTSFTGEVSVFPNAQAAKFFHESPASGDVVSGVGVIRGWACYFGGRGQVGAVTYTLDDHPLHFDLPYGALRTDTADACGYEHGDSTNTGYGGVFYWGHLADGEHTLTLYLDGEEMDSVTFSVAEPPPTDIPEDVGFRKGAEGEYVVETFLGTEETVTIRWSEADQNFIIVDYD